MTCDSREQTLHMEPAVRLGRVVVGPRWLNVPNLGAAERVSAVAREGSGRRSWERLLRDVKVRGNLLARQRETAEQNLLREISHALVHFVSVAHTGRQSANTSA